MLSLPLIYRVWGAGAKPPHPMHRPPPSYQGGAGGGAARPGWLPPENNTTIMGGQHGSTDIAGSYVCSDWESVQPARAGSPAYLWAQPGKPQMAGPQWTLMLSTCFRRGAAPL